MTTVLQTHALAKSFTLHLRGGLHMPVLSNIDLFVRAGECVVLAGPSGAGKSTLMRTLYGNYRPNGGQILIRHRDEMIDIARADPRTILAVRKETLGYVSQFLRVVPRVPALDIVAERAHLAGSFEQAHLADGFEQARLTDGREQARALLVRLNIPERLHKIPPATFSGGEQQRINLARGFIANRPILLLDEPTASLDAENRAVVIDMVRGAKASGTAIVAICHDVDVRDAIADRLFTMTPYQEAA